MATSGMELFHRIPVAGLIVNPVGKPNFIFNAEFLSLAGFSEEEMNDIIRNDIERVFDKEDLNALRIELKQARGTSNIVSREMKLHNSKGELIYTYVEAETTENNDGDYVLCSLINISELKKTQISLHKERKRLYTLISCTQDYVFEYNFFDDSMVIFFEIGFEKKEGGIPSKTYPRFMERARDGKFIHREDSFKLLAWLNGLTEGPLEIRIQREQDKKFVWVEIQGTCLYDELGRPEQVIGIMRDINDSKEAELLLKKKADRDSLTKLYNHAYIERTVSDYLEGEGRDRENVLMVIDLDDFKNVNDTFGHRFGDKVLKEVAKDLTKSFGKNDIVGRIGGDEYLIFCPDVLDIQSIKEKVESLFLLFENNPVGTKEQYVIHASIGAAVSSKERNTYKKLFNCADKGMYAVKRSGKNNFNLVEND